ncbi:MAG: hypothetical protein ACR2OU_13350 [Thermomicrobiales bacterium]
MADTQTYTLTPSENPLAQSLVAPAIAFCDAQSFPLGAATIRHHWQGAPAQPVIAALAAYQNPDGGFGNNLEVDIKSPVSNPFAARLAMQVVLALNEDTGSDLQTRFGAWLKANQNVDGDWHFAPAVFDSPLPFWFAGWKFPSLNPACCVAGLASQLGLATTEMLGRVAALFAEHASLAQARTGEFYDILPYVEHVPWINLDQEVKDTWLQAIADGIVRMAEGGAYADASHFFDHALAGGPELARLIPSKIIGAQITRLLAEASSDGGWPTPYDQGWRAHATMSAMVTLARLRDGV